MTRLIPAIALAVTFLATAAGLRYAETAGLIAPDMAQRAVQVMIGLMLAGYANLMPKQLGSRRLSVAAEGRMQVARRIGGWALTLAGLAHAVIWVFVPVNIASLASMAVVGTGLALTVGVAVGACRRAGTSGTATGS